MTLPDAEQDAIPQNGIALSAAFTRWCERSVPDWQRLLDAITEANRNTIERRMTEERFSMIWAPHVKAERAAASAMRQALAAGELVAYFRDPATGDILSPPVPRDWLELSADAPLSSDFFSPDDPDFPGPMAQSQGRRRRLFFWQKDFDSWLARSLGRSEAKGKKRGPKYKYDWIEGEQYFQKLMAEMGDLDERQEWSAKADIERKVLDHMKKHGGGEPAPSLVQAHVAEWLARFRSNHNPR